MLSYSSLFILPLLIIYSLLKQVKIGKAKKYGIILQIFTFFHFLEPNVIILFLVLRMIASLIYFVIIIILLYNQVKINDEKYGIFTSILKTFYLFLPSTQIDFISKKTMIF